MIWDYLFLHSIKMSGNDINFDDEKIKKVLFIKTKNYLR